MFNADVSVLPILYPASYDANAALIRSFVRSCIQSFITVMVMLCSSLIIDAF